MPKLVQAKMREPTQHAGAWLSCILTILAIVVQ